MKRMWTIIGVDDVSQSFKWYQSLLGLPETAPAHDDFGQIIDSDGTVLLCLHEWGAHEYPSLTSPHYAKPGNGLLLFFPVDNFDVASRPFEPKASLKRKEKPLGCAVVMPMATVEQSSRARVVRPAKHGRSG